MEALKIKTLRIKHGNSKSKLSEAWIRSQLSCPHNSQNPLRQESVHVHEGIITTKPALKVGARHRRRNV